MSQRSDAWRDIHTIGNNGSRYNWTHETFALGKAETLKTATDGVDETEPGSFPREICRDVVVVHIVCNVLEDSVWLWPQRRLAESMRAHGSRSCKLWGKSNNCDWLKTKTRGNWSTEGAKAVSQHLLVEVES
jgi:hypothetical protein